MISTGSVVTYLIFESCDIVISHGGIADIKKHIGTAKHKLRATDESQSRKLQNLNQPAKFFLLIFRKIINFVPTRCQILRLKCTKFNFGWGFAPDPTGELTVLPQNP